MRPLYLSAALVCSVIFAASGQCLTDFTKLLPTPAIDFANGFGQSFSVYDDVLAVGIPGNDSLGRITGIVYLYERQADNSWKWFASKAPSDPTDGLQFGVNVKLSEHYLVIGASSVNGGFYVYKKTGTDWTTGTEDFKLTDAHATAGTLDPIAISDDELTLAIADQYVQVSTTPPYRDGAVYVYHRDVMTEWDSDTPTRIIAQEDEVGSFGRSGVSLLGDRLVTGSPFAPGGLGQAYIFRDPTGEFDNIVLETRLKTTAASHTAYIGFNQLIFLDEGILSVVATDQNFMPSQFAFYEKPASGNWDPVIEPTCVITLSNAPSIGGQVSLSTNGHDIYVGYQDGNGDSKFGIVKKGAGGWCNATLTVLETVSKTSGPYSNFYGTKSSASGDNVVVGMATMPALPNAPLALQSFHKNGGTWDESLFYLKKKTTAGHLYGYSVLNYENNLFVGAPNDGSVKRYGGAVYGYKKIADTWTKTSKILIPDPKRYDDVFGYSLATNGEQLAVGAPGFEETGRVFIYNPNSDWTNWILAQEIDVFGLGENVYASGDNVAMSKDWLLIPYVISAPARTWLAIYQKSGTGSWNYFQSLEIGFPTSRETTLGVDIEDETIVCGASVIERNHNGQWEIKYYLTPSDPEPAQISHDFTHWITDGDAFGSSTKISGDNIFIGAPRKDDGSTWNVGAVYVYSRKPGFAWSTTTETAKLLPRVKDENELFGYRLDALFNTLIVGAPGADYNKDGVTARNKPGRAYIFQSQDYFWENVIPLMDFTGDTFAKDYFGLAVGLDGDNFIIGAPIEDIETGALSGSVYVAPSPPIIKLIPPVCSTLQSFDLFGYPFGGTWSGDALTDANEGIFSPSLAGPGVHIFEYTTPSCTFTGKLMVTVSAPPVINSHSETDVKVCKESSFVASTLTISSSSNNLRWYYRATDEDDFEPLMEFGNSMTATQRGQYFARIVEGGCVVDSPVFTISDENVDLVVDEPAPMCLGESITLHATTSGGTWLGNDIANSVFKPGSSGTYQIVYSYASPHSCSFEKAIQVEVVSPPAMDIRRTGNLCADDQVSLLTDLNSDAITVDWYFKEEGTTGFEAITGTSVSTIVYSNGSYRAIAKVGACTVTDDIEIDDNLGLTFNENEDKVRVCHDSFRELVVVAPGTPAYEWSFSEEPTGDASPVSTGSSVQLERSGFYQVHVSTARCSAVGPVFDVQVMHADTLSAPNVFTPNGDGKNDKFVVLIGTGDSQMIIMNRNGNEVFTGGSGRPWDGGNFPTGTYFWVATGDSCEGDKRVAKGYVQLIR